MVMKSSLLSGFKPMTPLGFVIVVRAFASLLVAFLVERWTLSTMFWLFAIRLDEVASVLSLLKVLSIFTFWGGHDSVLIIYFWLRCLVPGFLTL